jgi:fibronectin type 3 domain-containing protein
MSRIKLQQQSASWLVRVELLVFLGIAAIFACKNYNPVAVTPPGKGTLPAPTKLLVKVGNGVVELAWAFESDTTQVKEYRVYRKNQNEAAFRRIVSTKVRRYRDNNLTNGVRLFYQIAAVNKSNVEGARSDSVAAIPAIYSIQLAGGARYTNSPNVSLAITAPANTALMMISNDSSFAGARWEAVVTPRTWTLTPGEGRKKVFAKFRNVDDQETSSPVQAEIVLDTIANIKSFKVDTSRLKAFKTLHFELKADEKDGVATADIVDAVNNASGQERNIRLYDDGTNGDRFKDDGVYERDYVVRSGLEAVNAYVYGNFTDAARNVAAVATAAIRITIQSPPTAVVLQEPTAIAGSMTSLSLRWTPNTDTDFASYQIRRSQDANVSLSSILVKEFNDPKVISYVDSGLDPGTTYYYRVYVFDTAGNNTGSNSVKQTTPVDSPPTPVVLQEPTTIAGSSTSLSLRWTPNSDNDFASYQIRRSPDPVVSLSSMLVKEFIDPKTTSYIDNGLDPGTKYFYRVYVFDAAGNNAGSNIVQQATPVNEAPKAVVLSQPVEEVAALTLGWSSSKDNDFANYRLYRSTVSLVDTAAAPIVVINNASTTTYRDTGVVSNVVYYYRVFVFDQFGLSAGSNQVQGRPK